MRFTSSLTKAAASLFLLLPLAVNAMGVQVIIDGQTVVFVDVPQSAWYATFVHDAAQAGIVNGYRDDRGNLTGKFGPEKSITFAEALKVAIEGAGFDEQAYGSVIDSGIPSHWASAYMSVAKAEDFPIVHTHYRVDVPATRAQVAELLTGAFGIDLTNVTAVSSRYNDVKASTDFAASIEALSRDGVVSGDTDIHGQALRTFRPTDPVNRAEVVKMVMKAREVYGQPGTGKTPDTQNESSAITYTAAGFSPAVAHVKTGTRVTFKNDSGEDLWVASNPHPSHTDYPGFDSLKALKHGDTYTFTFTRLGTFGYHNHLRPQMMGTIVVE